MTRTRHWADVLALRDEIIATGGQIADLQMSLYSAVYSDRDVPYHDPVYYSNITEPTVGLLSFIGAVARRLGTESSAGKALFHLDQGMGGGKSHALVGLYHLGNNPDKFFATELGQQVATEAGRQGPINLSGSRVVVLSADNMTPGATSPEFGPATSLYERFLWSLFKGDRAAFAKHSAEGPNKAALVRAMEAVNGPVLILLDELMDYAMLLSDQRHIGRMPGEKAFLNNLLDAVDDVARVAFVVVMIRSDLDEKGYGVEAEDFRAYVASRLERNGTTVAVTEAQDFSAIIRRRLFERSVNPPTGPLAAEWRAAADGVWTTQVFNRLGATRSLGSFSERLASSYPFHPELMNLVREDWSRHAGFQRVRSTVEIFAATANYWTQQHKNAQWAPALIGVGDIPLTVALEQVLSSGLLHGNERAVQGFRQVAATDVVNKDGTKGRARELDKSLIDRGITAGQPAPAQRMATALFCYSLVPRAQAKRGATKAELLAAVFEPGLSFQVGEEILNLLTSDEEGLGALEVAEGGGGSTPARYQLAITQTLRMFFKQAKASVDPADRDRYLWERTKAIAAANGGPFDQVIPIAQPDVPGAPLAQIFGDVDQNAKTRLVILDPRRWVLLNGKDTPTRTDITSAFGIGPNPLQVDNAASSVVACVNAQRRDNVRKRAADVLAWKAVLPQLEQTDEKREEAREELRTAVDKVDTDLQKAFQHFAYLVRSDKVALEWKRFDDDTKSSLKGSHIWDALVEAGRGTRGGTLSTAYLTTLLEKLQRDLTLKEIVQQFYKNPAFPLLANTEDVRRAIFESLRVGYELVSGDGTILAITNQNELALGSMDQTLRKARPKAAATATGAEQQDERPGSTIEAGHRDTTKRSDYRVYRLEVAHRSIVDTGVRAKLANLLTELAETVDPEVGGDVQLIDVNVQLTADTRAVEKLSVKAGEAHAKWTEEKPDF